MPTPARDAPVALGAEASLGAARLRLVVLMLGLRDEALERALDLVVLQCVERSADAVVVTDRTDLLPMRRRGLAVERLVDPDAARAARPELPWHLRLDTQLRALVRLWQPEQIVSLSQPPTPEIVKRLRRYADLPG